MIRCYEEGIDLYILTAKTMYPDEDYSDPENYVFYRNQFKVVLLALNNIGACYRNVA